MRLLNLFASLLFLILLAGCAKPLPPDKAAYAGLWTSQHMNLLITQDGRVSYSRRMGNASESIEGPIQEFEGNDFKVGIGPFSGKFVVSVPPHQEHGVWTMTVDGLVLTRK